MTRYTPTEQRILDLLRSDGLPHTRQELVLLLWDDQSPDSAIKAHLSNLRDKLKKNGGQFIIATLKYETNGPSFYQIMLKGDVPLANRSREEQR